MLLAVEAHVISARSVLFLLPRIGTAEVIGILGSPLLIGFLLLLAPTFGPTTRLLPSVQPRVRVIPMTTERTPPAREHTFLLQPTSSGETNLTSRQLLRKVLWSDSGERHQIFPDATTDLHISDVEPFVVRCHSAHF